jgi:hypothetical protein
MTRFSKVESSSFAGEVTTDLVDDFCREKVEGDSAEIEDKARDLRNFTIHYMPYRFRRAISGKSPSIEQGRSR